jgi:nascent polypeptide-associated complex subunit alpha
MFDSRQARRMLERLGVNLEEIEGVEEVVIRTKDKDIIIRDAHVAQVKAKGVTMFQVSGEEIEEVEKKKPKFSEEDILLVAQQAGVSRERAIAALEEANGDLAKAILLLTS